MVMRVEEAVVMMGKMVGKVFSVWRMGSILMFWVTLSVSSIIVGVCVLGGDGMERWIVVVGCPMVSSSAACSASAED